MAYEKKDGDFALFKNDRKTEDKHPDCSGEILLNGQVHFIDAWIKKTDKGTFMSGRVGKAKQPKGDAMPTRSNVPPPAQFDDEIPF